jgi:hypothetical protein
VKQLRGYIPLAAPLNWEPVTGNESAHRCVISFTCDWFYKRLGIDFSEKYHTDPVYRFESVFKMKKYVQSIFPQVSCFREHDGGGFEQECATISNVYGVCFFAMLYGLKPSFFKNNWPAVHPKDHLSIEAVKKLKPFELQNHPLMEKFLIQMDEIAKRWGKIDGYMNYQGTLNNAFKIRGTDIFLDMADDHSLCEFLLEHIADTMIQLIDIIQQRQRESGFYINSFGMSHCTVNMISPDDYVKFLYTHDNRFAEKYDGFGIHSCNWILDPYIDRFSRVKNLGYIDFGSKSNLKKIREAFPNVRRHVFYDPAFLVQKSRGEVCADIERICAELGNCDICLPDADLSIPDAEIIAFNEKVEQMK